MSAVIVGSAMFDSRSRINEAIVRACFIPVGAAASKEFERERTKASEFAIIGALSVTDR